MNREEFWKLIERSLPGDEEQAPRLAAVLEVLPADEVQSFDEHWGELMNAAYRSDLWAAAFVVQGGCSDDAFMDFRHWLIGQGKATYGAALADPDSLLEAVSESFPFYEELGYVAARVYEAKIGKEMQWHDDAVHPQLTGPKWESEEDAKALVPKLWARFAPEWH